MLFFRILVFHLLSFDSLVTHPKVRELKYVVRILCILFLFSFLFLYVGTYLQTSQRMLFFRNEELSHFFWQLQLWHNHVDDVTTCIVRNFLRKNVRFIAKSWRYNKGREVTALQKDETSDLIFYITTLTFKTKSNLHPCVVFYNLFSFYLQYLKLDSASLIVILLW